MQRDDDNDQHSVHYYYYNYYYEYHYYSKDDCCLPSTRKYNVYTFSGGKKTSNSIWNAIAGKWLKQIVCRNSSVVWLENKLQKARSSNCKIQVTPTFAFFSILSFFFAQLLCDLSFHFYSSIYSYFQCYCNKHRLNTKRYL